MPITVSGTQITFNDATVQTTAFTGGGGVTSLNGQTGAITNTSTNTIGSYIVGWVNSQGATYSYGDTYSGSSIRLTSNTGDFWYVSADPFGGGNSNSGVNPSLSGTWRAMTRGKSPNANPDDPGAGWNNTANLWVRIS